MLQHLLALAAGVGLSAAAGFRVFVPLLALGLAGRADVLHLSGDFAWVSSTPALIALGTATLVEIGAYYVPWLDHLLDTVATPAAVGAGVVASAAVLGDMPPSLRWALAVIAGGGAAGVVQGSTVLARLKSTALTGGFANPVVATLELGGALLTTLLAIFVPILGLLLVALVVALLVRRARRARRAAGQPIAANRGS